MPKTIHVHLVSDSTGDTVHHVAQACLSQFDNLSMEQHVWPLVRGESQVQNLLKGLKKFPGLVIATFADAKINDMLRKACEQNNTPYVSVLDPVLQTLSKFIGEKTVSRPGKQHELTQEYFERMEAIDFAMHHDDGQLAEKLALADVVLVGVSRTSKTPTCIYLSHRGIKAANVPIVPGRPLPPELMSVRGPLIVGLSNDPLRLVQIRQSRLQMLGGNDDQFHAGQSYTDPDQVRAEIREANRLFADMGWPVIDTTRKSIEETAALILQLLQEQRVGATG